MTGYLCEGASLRKVEDCIGLVEDCVMLVWFVRFTEFEDACIIRRVASAKSSFISTISDSNVVTLFMMLVFSDCNCWT